MDVKLESPREAGLDIKVSDDNTKGEIRQSIHLYGKPDDDDDALRVRVVAQWSKLKADLKVVQS